MDENLKEIFKERYENFWLPLFRRESREMAQDFVDTLIRHIRKNELHVVPLTEKYAKRKQKLNMPDIPLIATEQYIESLEIYETNDGLGYYVTINEDAWHDPIEKLSSNRIKMRDLALMLEYGTKKMIARPHWRPTQREMEAKYRDPATRLREMYQNCFEEAERILEGYVLTGTVIV